MSLFVTPLTEIEAPDDVFNIDVDWDSEEIIDVVFDVAVDVNVKRLQHRR